MESPHVIYGLFDPETHELRYIGLTSNLKKRYDKHHCPSNLRDKSYKNHWIRSLLLKDQKAEVYVLETYLTAEELPQAEIEQIEYYKFVGCNLTNLTDGGEGLFGMKHSEETKRKMSLAAIIATDNSEKEISPDSSVADDPSVEE